jgi:hypothetical protein
MDTKNTKKIYDWAKMQPNDKFDFLRAIHEDPKLNKDELSKFATGEEDGLIKGCSKDFEVFLKSTFQSSKLILTIRCLISTDPTRAYDFNQLDVTSCGQAYFDKKSLKRKDHSCKRYILVSSSCLLQCRNGYFALEMSGAEPRKDAVKRDIQPESQNC